MCRFLGTTDAILRLSKKIAKCSQIGKYHKSNDSDPESWVIAYSLSEIESSYKIYNDLLRQLSLAESSEQVFSILSEIREEFRHIVYHIRDSDFLKMIL